VSHITGGVSGVDPCAASGPLYHHCNLALTFSIYRLIIIYDDDDSRRCSRRQLEAADRSIYIETVDRVATSKMFLTGSSNGPVKQWRNFKYVRPCMCPKHGNRTACPPVWPEKDGNCAAGMKRSTTSG
jgi:hypothetical protein